MLEKSKEWHERRKQHIGGSDAANILGLGYGSSLEVYLNKTTDPEPIEQNEKMEWGTRLEDSIRQKYGDESGNDVNRGNEYFEHPKHAWMGCEVDGVIEGDPRGPGVLECKNVGTFMRDKWDDKVPEMYLIQLHHNITVTGFTWGVLCVLIGGQEYRSFEYERDNELSAMLIQREGAFWKDHVLAKIPPDPTGNSADLIARLYPNANDTELIVTDDVIGDALKTFMSERDLAKQHKEAKEDAEAIVKNYMGEASKGVYDDGDTTIAINWGSRAGRVGFDAKSFEVDHPKLYKQYAKTGSSYRVFMVKKKKLKIEKKREAIK